MSSRNGDGESGPFYTTDRVDRLFTGREGGVPLSKEDYPIMHWVWWERIRRVDDRGTGDALMALLGYVVTMDWRVRDLEREGREDARAISRLYDYLSEQQMQIRRLEDQVDNLRARLSVMENREAERVALEAVESFEGHGDIEALLDDLGRPESMREGRET